MRSLKKQAGVLMFAPLLLSLGGCSRVAAPSFALFGAFFPGWMFCAFLGIVVAVVARVVLVATGLSIILPHQMLLCVSVGLIFALVAWLLWFG